MTEHQVVRVLAQRLVIADPAELVGQRDGAIIARIDITDQVRQLQGRTGPVSQCRGCLKRVTVPFVASIKQPAQFLCFFWGNSGP